MPTFHSTLLTTVAAKSTIQLATLTDIKKIRPCNTHNTAKVRIDHGRPGEKRKNDMRKTQHVSLFLLWCRKSVSETRPHSVARNGGTKRHVCGQNVGGRLQAGAPASSFRAQEAASCLQYSHAWLLHRHRVEFSPLCETPERLRGLEKKSPQSLSADAMWWISREQQQQQRQYIEKINVKKSSVYSRRKQTFGRD